MKLSFREACLAAYDKEVADLRKDFERAIERGDLSTDETYKMQIWVDPGAIRVQYK